VNSRGGEGDTSTRAAGPAEIGTAKKRKMETAGRHGSPGESAEDGGWKTAGPASNRTGQGDAGGQREEQADRRSTAATLAARRPSPSRAKGGKPSFRVGSGKPTGAADQGDGKAVFSQLRQYLINGALQLYSQHTVVRLNNLAKDRRFKTYLRSLTATEREENTTKELRRQWKDEAPLSRQQHYEGMRSSWNMESSEHQGRLATLMHDCVITAKETQREIENRLQFFHFHAPDATQEGDSPENKAEATPVSYLTAVAGVKAQAATETSSQEHDRLRTLCMEPAIPTLRLRERTPDEAKAIIMILNHEIEIPRVPAFLTQLMTAGELACFEDLFMALEYPLYAHLAPGQRFFNNMSKSAILAQIYVGAEAAALQQKDVLDFKSGLSRITMDMETRVVTVTFKGKQ
jgi:hypothetical protein